MKEAGRMTEAAFAETLKQLKFGMTELDVIAEVDYQMKRQGSLGPTFTTSLYNTGPNHPLLMGQRLESWKRPLEPPVLGAVRLRRLASRGSATTSAARCRFGEPSAEQVKVHRLIMESQRAGIAALKAGQRPASAVDTRRASGGGRGLRPEFPPPPRPRHRLGRARAALPDEGATTPCCGRA